MIVFLVATSVVGVLLILLAVYNASRDLKLLSEIDSLYSFASASIKTNELKREFMQAIENDTSTEYHIMVLEDNQTSKLHEAKIPYDFPIDIEELETSRQNEKGGYVLAGEITYTWAMVPDSNSDRYLIFIHTYSDHELSNLVTTYSKRLFVPGAFYIWLMVWVGLILKFLTEKLHSQNEELQHMALHDSLTGLPNRVLLQDRLQKLIQMCQRNNSTFAIALIDLNKFKQVNDELGHDQGDELLCHVTERIKTLLRASDTAARIGGDEFVLLLNNADKSSSLRMCERVKDSLLEPYRLRDEIVTIGLSIGVSIFPEHGTNPIELMRKADMSMYDIKFKGGGVQIYTDDYMTKSNRTTEIITNFSCSTHK